MAWLYQKMLGVQVLNTDFNEFILKNMVFSVLFPL